MPGSLHAFLRADESDEIITRTLGKHEQEGRSFKHTLASLTVNYPAAWVLVGAREQNKSRAAVNGALNHSNFVALGTEVSSHSDTRRGLSSIFEGCFQRDATQGAGSLVLIINTDQQQS
ncbi:hypothetical protein RRG08_054738 [Elysia crispata]|uniref:Uncharacterized protein n=1 Tax=Elysia crispata TaxID=231223 RepID=A0AAE1B2J8_9GAST|nr:hypothetical protein RRG08_054738 [Elysia crispata]